MSINTLANSAAARRGDTVPLGRAPADLKEIATFSGSPPSNAAVALSPQGNIETALNVVFGYIPTEIVTIYIAVLAAIGQEGKVTSGEWIAFLLFTAATPVVVWLVYAAKLKNAGLPPPTLATWPVWEMTAATTAFLAWGFGLPQSPFSQFTAWYSPALAGVILLSVSTILGLLAPLFQRRLG